MSHYYRLITNEEELTVGPIHTIERTDGAFTLLDQSGEIVVMLKKERVEGIIRVPEQTKEPPEPPKKHQELLEPKISDPVITSLPHPAFNPEMKQLKEPINKDGTIDGLPLFPKPMQPEPARTYQFKQNRETKAYEVHSRPNENMSEPIKTKTGSASPKQTEPDRQRVTLRYKDIVIHAAYEPDSKKVIVPKGSLICRKETNSLRKAKNHAGARLKRRKILNNMVKGYNDKYSRTTKDIEFSSLSQAGCVISGTVLNNKQWHMPGDMSGEDQSTKQG